MAKTYQTPGVYISELDAFPNSVVPIDTAVPAFIGYTEKVDYNKKSLILKPFRLSSLSEYVQVFGGGPATKYNINGSIVNYEVEAVPTSQFLLYDSIQFFFLNGGGSCYIVSVGGYDYENGVKKMVLEEGLKPLEREDEPTILIAPDTISLTDEMERNDLHQKMLQHCADQQNRIAILDVPNGYNDDFQADITSFRNGIGTQNLQWGAAYFPLLNTSITSVTDLDFTVIKSGLTGLLNEAVDASVAEKQIDGEKGKKLKEEIAKMDGEDHDESLIKSIHKTLLATLPVYKNVFDKVAKCRNLLPPSGAMAGIYTMVDNDRGVWKAPANVRVAGVISPAVNIKQDEQEDLNSPTNGKAVNAIRSFPGQGVLVWGARTLDGNSLDWRYINVRRTMIFIEQSIRLAAKAYVFAPNDDSTWTSLKSMISSFLTSVWKDGGLVGAAPSDAFNVEIGLGATMTPDDILNGIMRVTIKVAVIHPAEFIVVTFEQQMQRS